MQEKKSNKKTNAKTDAEQIIAKTVTTAKLLDAYGILLPEKQRKYLSYFYEEDFSLAEIGEKFHISRQAVHDAIRHGEAQLKDYEEVLHLIAKDNERQDIAQILRSKTGNDKTINGLIEQLL